MKLSREFLQDRIKYFNNTIFKTPLPEIPITLSDVKTYMGQCRFRRKLTPEGKYEYYDFSFRFNTRYDLPQNQWEDIILHEMIHYLIMYRQITDTSPHGKYFRSLMKEINKRFARNITIRVKLNPNKYL